MFVAVVIMQCACVVLSSVACSAVPQLSVLFHKRNNWKKKHKMCVSIFSTAFVWNIFHPNNNSARYRHKFMLIFMNSVRYCQILIKLPFAQQIFEKKTRKCQISLKIRQMWAEFLRVDGQTDRRAERQTGMTQLIVAFRNFANASIHESYVQNLFFWRVCVALSTVERKTFAYCFRGQIGTKRKWHGGRFYNECRA